MTPVKTMIYGLVLIALACLRRSARGRGNLPRSAGYVMAANHASYLDHLILYCEVRQASGRSPFFLAKKEYWESSLSRFWSRQWNMIPVDRTASGQAVVKESLEVVKELLNQGEIVVIYPEGTRTRTGHMLPFKNGVAWVAMDCHVPIVPVGLAGTGEILPPDRLLPNPCRRFALEIGKPIAPESFADKPKQVTAGLRDAIVKLHGKADRSL